MTPLDDAPWPTDADAPAELERPRTQKRPRSNGHALADERGCTDLGNASRFADQHALDVRYTKATGFHVFDGVCFRPDRTFEITRRAEQTVRSIYVEASQASTNARRKALAAHAAKSEKRSAIESMVALARADERIVTTPDAFDRDLFAFNCPNGTIDLHTGKLQPHRREDLITKASPIAFDPAAKAPTFERFMGSVFGEPEVAAFVMRWLGYAMTGDVREQAMVVAHGTGANGKSTLLDVVAHVFGDYHVAAPPHLLVARKHEAHPTERTMLHGARLVTAIEIGEGKRWDEELVKMLTGGDRITARQMRRDFYTFDATHKLTVACNHLPGVRGNDHAIWRRLFVVPFARRFDGSDRDPEMGAKLRSELPGILAALVRGCLEWQRRGLQPPDAVRLATTDYREEQDQLARFIAECCLVGDAFQVNATDLFNRYRVWCQANGEHAVTLTAFGRALGDRGFAKRQIRTGVFRLGLGLVEEQQNEGSV